MKIVKKPKSRESVEKWKNTMARKYGDYREHMRQIGAKGGEAERDELRGFALNRELAIESGRKGGRISRQNKKFLGESEGVRRYLDKKTGKIVEYKI